MPASRAITHRRIELPERRERAVAGEQRGLGIVGRGHAFETQVYRAGLAFDPDEVGIELQRRVGDDLEARAVEADAGEREHRGDIDGGGKMRPALARRALAKAHRASSRSTSILT